MKAYIASELPAVTGIVARVEMLYEGPRIRFSGASGNKAAVIEVTMHPEDALGLAWDLICCAESHGKDTLRRVQWIRRRMEKRLKRDAAIAASKGGGTNG
jgi:hypothetical protein